MLRFRPVMFSGRRVSGRRFWGALALALLAALAACAPVVGGGALVAVVAIGALTSHCYDYIDVTVLDAQGQKTCAATVTASNGSDEFELKSCYYAPLTDGHWTIRAWLPGFPDAVSAADVEHANDCTRHVQSMELTLTAPGSAPAVPPALPANPVAHTLRLPPPPPPQPQAPQAPVAPTGSPAPAPPATPSSAAPASSALPPAAAAPTASPAPPSVGVFPEQGAAPSQPI